MWVDQERANRAIIASLEDLKEEESVLAKAWKWKKEEVKCKGNQILFFPGLWPNTPLKRQTFIPVKKVFLPKNVEVATLLPAKLKMNYENKTHIYWDLQSSATTCWEWLNSGRSGF